MPIFYLHLQSGSRVVDHEGSEHPDVEAARQEAITAAREIIADHIRAGKELEDGAIEICSTEGIVLDTVLFADIVRLRPIVSR